MVCKDQRNWKAGRECEEETLKWVLKQDREAHIVSDKCLSWDIECKDGTRIECKKDDYCWRNKTGALFVETCDSARKVSGLAKSASEGVEWVVYQIGPHFYLIDLQGLIELSTKFVRKTTRNGVNGNPPGWNSNGVIVPIDAIENAGLIHETWTKE